jgi:hypothetical protein
VSAVPGVHKTVKIYGVEGQGWFRGTHCFAKYVKVAFFRGASLRPTPLGESKQKEVRYLDIHEDDQLDEAQVAKPPEPRWCGYEWRAFDRRVAAKFVHRW